MTYGISFFLVLVLSQIQVNTCVIFHYTYLFLDKHLSHDTFLRPFRLHIASIYTYMYNTSLQQLFTSQNRYCEEAVNSVKNVTSCPTSKTEWDIAALRKNCSGIASGQNCVNAIEKFQYHCVINGLRDKLIELCAPTRIIFGIFYSYVIFNFFNYTFFLKCQISMIFRILCWIQCSWWSNSRSEISSLQRNISKVWQDLFIFRSLQM